MVKKIFSDQPAGIISANLPDKTAKKNGKTYVLVNNDPIKVSKCTSLIKAIGLSLLAGITFGGALGKRSIRTSFLTNWRAVFKGNILVERYELRPTLRFDVPSTSSRPQQISSSQQTQPSKTPAIQQLLSSQTQQKVATLPQDKQKEIEDILNPLLPLYGVPSPQQVQGKIQEIPTTQTTASAKASTAKNAPAKKQKKLSDKETMQVIFHGLGKSYKKQSTIEKLEADRKILIEWLKDPRHKYSFIQQDENFTYVSLSDLQSNNIKMDSYTLQAALRYMVLKGDIFAYESNAAGWFPVAIKEDGIQYFQKSYEKPITKEILLNIHAKMKDFTKPPAPANFNNQEKGLWKSALKEIQWELYRRLVRSTPESLAVESSSSQHQALKFKSVYDQLVLSGVITSWNVTYGQSYAILKIDETDTVSEQKIFVYEKWRDKSLIES